MRRMQMRLFTTAIACAAVWHLVWPQDATAAQAEKIQVQLKLVHGKVILDVQTFIDATPREVWSVFTDYDHMTEFLSNLEKSKIVVRKGQTLLVWQQGKNRLGPFSSSFESLREIQLTPFRLVHSRGVGGTVKNYEAITRFTPEGSGTRVFHHLEFTPNRWIPPLIGPAIIERQTRVHFEEILREIARRFEGRIHAAPPQDKRKPWQRERGCPERVPGSNISPSFSAFFSGCAVNRNPRPMN